MNIVLQRLMANKHTTGAALVYGLLSLAGHIALRWFPSQAAQINGTLDDIKQFAVIYGFAMAGDSGRKDQPPDSQPIPSSDKSMKIIAIVVGITALAMSFVTGCASKLESGGAYAPISISTNASGIVTTNATATPDIGLFFADAAYKTAYDLVDGCLAFEMNNRAQLQSLSPSIKIELDKVRLVAWDIDQRWAIARKAYLANPTPAGLTDLQLIFAELQKLLPIITKQTGAITQSLTTK